MENLDTGESAGLVYICGMSGIFSDEYYMQKALQMAQMAFEEGEVPIGAVVVADRQVIGRGYNQTEKLNDATAHAEMLALTAASETIGSKYLRECDLFVTIEPCAMCAGALRWTQIRRVIFGAHEPKFGYSRFSADLIHPKTDLVTGIMADECRALMQTFFQARRSNS